VCETNLGEKPGLPDIPAALAVSRDRVAVAFARSGVRIWNLGPKGSASCSLWIWRGELTARQGSGRRNGRSCGRTCPRSALSRTARQSSAGRRTACYGTARCRASCARTRSSRAKCAALSLHSVHGIIAYAARRRRSIAVSADGRRALISQADGCAALVTELDSNRGQIARLYAVKDPALSAVFAYPARFVARDTRVLWGSAGGFALVWDPVTGEIVRGLDHGDDPVATALAVRRLWAGARVRACVLTAWACRSAARRGPASRAWSSRARRTAL
jgi:hypothetical protein